MKAILLVGILALFSLAAAQSTGGDVLVVAGDCSQDPTKCAINDGQLNSYIEAGTYGGSLSSAPTAGKVISIIGDCRGGDCVRLHQGIDIANRIGTPIRAAAGGIVTKAQPAEVGNCGVYVRIDHPNGLHTVYCHLLTGSIVVTRGQVVQAGQMIAQMGNTGNARSTVTHLHFEVKAGQKVLDPCAFYYCKRNSVLH